jgi:hypothetical protein
MATIISQLELGVLPACVEGFVLVSICVLWQELLTFSH